VNMMESKIRLEAIFLVVTCDTSLVFLICDELDYVACWVVVSEDDIG